MQNGSEPAKLVGLGSIAEMLNVSPSHVRNLVKRGVLPAIRTSGGHRRFDPIAVLDAWNKYLPTRHKVAPVTIVEHRSLNQCDEAEVWNAIHPKMHLPETARAIAQYVTTEIVNNAVDHSGGSQVTVTALGDHASWTMEVADDGEGIFEHLAAGLGLANPLESLGELSKGKRTTDPTRHTGQGIFFSSKAVAVFTIEANGLRVMFDNARNDISYGTSLVTTGSVVRYTFDRNTKSSLKALFDEFSDEDFRFAKTKPRVRLFEIGVRFVSRSEAKRIGVGLDEFEAVELDFTGVEDIGQGFADELFRVWANSHPNTTLEPIGMNAAVEFMVRRTIKAAK